MVDLIQQDFPRTPSPIFSQKRQEDEVITSNTLQPSSVLQPQPKQQKAQILQRGQPAATYVDREDQLVNICKATATIKETLQDFT